MVSTISAPLCSRPPFPSGWNSIPMSLTNLSLENTLPVGQSFLWHRHPLPSSSSSTHIDGEPTEEYSRALHSPRRVVLLRQTPSRLYYAAVHPDPISAAQDAKEGTTKSWLDDYFHLDKYPSLENLYTEWRERDPGLFGRTEVDGRARGVRVLRQDPWECLIAFITSTNNHIPRIGSLMHRLSQHFSPALLSLPHPGPSEEDSITYHLFPPPDSIPLERLEPLLRELGFGYRAGFLESTLITLREAFGEAPGDIEAGLMSYRTTDVEVVREKLVGLKGVGRKVADCVMLMSMDQKPSLIPIDTHLSAIAARHPQFPSKWKNKPMSKALYEDVQDWLLDKWGPMGGWAQAVMFAADLPPATTAKTPAALRREAKVEIKLEGVPALDDSPASSISGRSTVLITPATERNVRDVTVKEEPDTPLKGKGRPPIVRAKSSGKRKAFHPEEKLEPVQIGVKQEKGEEMDLPAAYGFKRTRSASRIQLKRSESGVSAVAGELGELDV